MKVRVIGTDGSWGSVEGCYVNDFIRTGKVTAFYCSLSNEWVNVGHGFCEDCQIWHLAPPEDFHECVFHLQEKSENS